MKFSTVFAVTVVLLVFLTVQGWLINQKFVLSNRIQTDEAVIQGTTTEVRTPVWGQIASVAIQEDQKVTSGTPLFVIVPQERGRARVTVTAPADGVITDLVARPGQFVQGNESLAQLVDTSPDSVYVEARLLVPPESISKVRPKLLANVQAEYLNEGRPIRAVVTAVDPLYDAKTKTIEVRLRLLENPAELSGITTGLPVDVDFDASTGMFAGIRRAIARMIAPEGTSAEVSAKP